MAMKFSRTRNNRRPWGMVVGFLNRDRSQHQQLPVAHQLTRPVQRTGGGGGRGRQGRVR